MESNYQQLPKKSNLPKIILLILGIIIVGEVAFAAWTLTRPVNRATTVTPSITASGGKLILTAEKKVYHLKDVVRVTIGETTGSKSIEGTDVVIKYDPKVLEASSGAFEKGTLYQEYSSLSLDPDTGTVQISGFRAVNQKPIVGTGVFGTVSFKVKEAAKTALILDFTSDSTSDSNIVDASTGKDALEEVFNLDLDIQ